MNPQYLAMVDGLNMLEKSLQSPPLNPRAQNRSKPSVMTYERMIQGTAPPLWLEVEYTIIPESNGDKVTPIELLKIKIETCTIAGSDITMSDFFKVDEESLAEEIRRAI